MHERALKITYSGTSAFQELLHRENSASFFIFKQICFNASQEFANFGDRNVENSETFVCKNSKKNIGSQNNLA